MIRNIPQSLIESAKKQISEAVALKGHIDMANKASRSTKIGGKTRAELISQHVIPLGQDTITLPLERDTATPHPDVVDHLDKHGYDVHDYMKGLAIKKGEKKNPISIGKVLARTNASPSLKTSYEKDPSRQGIDSSVHVVISRNPVHVAGMSTHQNWESCQTLGGGGKFVDDAGSTQNLKKQDVGSLTEHVPHDISAGSHVVYLVHKPEDIDKHFKPISRILLKPYISDHGHTILKPMGSYGEEWNGFHSTISKWADKHFPMKDPEYTLDSTVYPDGPRKINNFAPEHDEYWKNHKNGNIAKLHPSEGVITHYIDKIEQDMHKSPGDTSNAIAKYELDDITQNPHLKENHVLRILNHDNILTHSARERLYKFPSDEVVGRGVSDPSAHQYIVNNPRLKTEHIEKILHDDHSDILNQETEEPWTSKHSNILHGLANHQNLSQHQADQLLQMDTTREFPSALTGLFQKASDEHINKTLDEMKEDTKSLVYYDKAFAKLAQHKPHMVSNMNNLMLLHAYNASPKNGSTGNHIEREMLGRGDMFHHILASRSLNKEHLNHVLSKTSDPNIIANAKDSLARIS